ncbi:hypothetical protein [Candidatus Chrysopegis kryptomonas]|uniref:Uncharacterized protein n=1 Tax=Candidatus Chryseopegocella kryptomonas TaxID=1633643 RepID=A0A0P1NT92_9BACT|nr:hypothetical protein [Candidatus Chrysopegis kryptomonas]CUT02199.1 hypothetical protein JGI23_01205 [Candidatus Chrysopegis kryptomonas]
METVTGLLYKEEQYLPKWIYFLIFAWIPIIFALPLFNPEFEKREALWLMLGGVIIFELFLIGFIGKMTVLVKWNELLVFIGFFRLVKFRIRKSEIKSVKLIDENLWRKFGGWGVRGTFGTVAIVYASKGGVEIEMQELKQSQSLFKKLTKVEKFIISSQNPARLMDAILSMT